jgi:hypothetical protein
MTQRDWLPDSHQADRLASQWCFAMREGDDGARVGPRAFYKMGRNVLNRQSNPLHSIIPTTQPDHLNNPFLIIET